MQRIKTKDVIAYATLPRIIPRAKVLFFSGFGYIAFLMAQIYSMVRLIPPGHPYLQAKNMGRFGIRHVMTEASTRLQYNRQNIDQLFIFFALFAAIAILIVQVILLAYSFIDPKVFASPFDVTNPAQDVGFQILDRVFGIPNMYNSPSTGTPTLTNAALPTAFHTALHDLFRFYSTALLFIAVLIFLYFVVVVILETATSGTPFGQRFQNVWVPIRLVVAVLLLLPINFGLNSAQYITLYTAKYGASWATNSWRLFNTTITLHPLFGVAADPLQSRVTGERYTMLAIPQQTDISALVASMALVHSCAYTYLRQASTMNAGAQGAGGLAPHYVYGDWTSIAREYPIRMYLVKDVADWMAAGTDIAGYPLVTATHRIPRYFIEDATFLDFKDAAAFYFGGDIIIRFGEYATAPAPAPANTPLYDKYEGGVKPTCGDIRIPVTALKDLNLNPDTVGGSLYMLREYYRLIMDMWFNDDILKRFARSYVTYNQSEGLEYAQNMCGAGAAAISGCGTLGFPACARPDCDVTPVNASLKSERIVFYRTRIDNAIRQAWGLNIVNGTDPNMTARILDCGWACAGAWFNKIAEINGMFMDGVRNIPVMHKFPIVMEQVSAAKSKINMNVGSKERFSPVVRAMSGQDPPKLNIEEGVIGLEHAATLSTVYDWWGGDTLNLTVEHLKSSANPLFDVMNFFMGTSGIINMRGANRHMHPLAQLVAVGKGLVDGAVQNIALSTGAAFMGGILGAFNESAGKGAEALSKMIISMAFLGLMAGFTLFYVLPFLPFVYFFFAVGTWVKTIFEAMVGTPLWALAHLRIDGEGLPGDAASNGYFLLLEIFIRPLLSIFGLVAAITIFAAQIHVLNIIWDLVLNNATGFQINRPDIFGMTQLATQNEYQRGVMDQFFFMILFVIVTYMLAIASFKLIDQIPNNIMRWAGVGVSAFGDMNAEQADAMGGYVSRGAMNIGQDVADAMRTGGAGLGGGLGQMLKNKGAGAGP